MSTVPVYLSQTLAYVTYFQYWEPLAGKGATVTRQTGDRGIDDTTGGSYLCTYLLRYPKEIRLQKYLHPSMNPSIHPCGMYYLPLQHRLSWGQLGIPGWLRCFRLVPSFRRYAGTSSSRTGAGAGRRIRVIFQTEDSPPENPHKQSPGTCSAYVTFQTSSVSLVDLLIQEYFFRFGLRLGANPLSHDIPISYSPKNTVLPSSRPPQHHHRLPPRSLSSQCVTTTTRNYAFIVLAGTSSSVGVSLDNSSYPRRARLDR